MKKCLQCIVVMLCLMEESSAYLDPGTGSLIIQTLLAAFAAIVVAGGHFWHRIKSFFIREHGSSDTEEEKEDEK